jgi:hypothetical protein
MRGLLAASVFLFANVAAAQGPALGGGADEGPLPAQKSPEPERDEGTKEDERERKEREKFPSRIQGSMLALENSVTAQTLGVGSDYQSYNPTYDVQLALRARYRFWWEGDDRSLSLAGRVALIREMTNSDTTTNHGEWDVNGADLTDAEVVLNYSHELAESGKYRTLLTLTAPNVSFPTSTVSRSNGKIIGVGTRAALAQTLPVREDQEFLPSANLQGQVGYLYTFRRAVVATNDGLERIRLDPLGRSIPSDQLNGAALAQHQVVFTLAAGLDITEILKLDVGLGWVLYYKYQLQEDVEVCNVATGCVQVEPVQDTPNAAVSSVFSTELTLDAPKPVAFSLAYQNLATQLGPDGQRRNVLYSPDARFLFSIQLKLDQFYEAVSPSTTMHSALMGSSGAKQH